MRSLVIFATRTGNTRRIAGAVAEALRRFGPAEVVPVEDVPPLPSGIDLLAVGGPTEAHGATDAILGLFETVGPAELDGMSAVAFDTRMRWPRVLSGSAALRIAEQLRTARATVIADPESFFVHGRVPELEEGELERAGAWASTLGERVSRLREAHTPA